MLAMGVAMTASMIEYVIAAWAGVKLKFAPIPIFELYAKAGGYSARCPFVHMSVA